MNPSTTALTLNMQLPNIATVSWAVQGDQLARIITATLVDGSTPWTPEPSYHGVVRFHKPDGTSGVYDVDEDGNPAVTWSGNVATIKIVQQALTCPGTVLMQLDFYDATDARITAFGWANNVQPSAVTDTEFISTDYYNILTLQISAVLDKSGFKYMLAQEETGNTSAHAYSVGNYFIYNDNLYIATASISVGGAITPGTNCTVAVLGNDVSTLRNITNSLSRPNLLDNWYFVGGGSQRGYGVFPINQRGQGSYTGGWSIDRWQIPNTINLTAALSGITIANTDATTRYSALQPLKSPNTLRGKTVTGSILLANGALYFGTATIPAEVPSSNNNISIAQVGNYAELRIENRTDGVMKMSITMSATQSMMIQAIKLEVGSNQTLAHQENGVWVLNEIPDYEEQLIRCQKYFRVLESEVGVGSGQYYNGVRGYSDAKHVSVTFDFKMAKGITASAPNGVQGAVVDGTGAASNLVSLEETTGSPNRIGFTVENNLARTPLGIYLNSRIYLSAE